MSETPKFTVIDRRKIKAEEEHESERAAARVPETAAPSGGPRLVVNEGRHAAGSGPAVESATAAVEAPVGASKHEQQPELPPAPTAEESLEQKTAYDASAQRLEDLIRAQNPAVGEQPAIGFEHLVQQFYVSAMIQLGAGTQEGQRPRVDILGARTTIDLLGVLAEKTKGNLTAAEDQMLQTVLFEARMAFLELTSMISLQAMQPPPPPPPGKQ
ncbi:MAG: DUF1844 domain-containing protein [Terracidiphilus sp.]|jgi:hypothetical protein